MTIYLILRTNIMKPVKTHIYFADKHHNTPLMTAIANKDIELCKNLLKDGSDPNE